MLQWWRNRRRERILEAPFPEAHREIIERNVGHVRHLDDEERQRLRDLVQVFLAEKTFEGCGGLTLTEEITVTVSANACLLLLGLDHDMYRRVQSILIYPSTVVPPKREGSVWAVADGSAKPQHPLLGEAHLGGPVILAWDATRHGSRNARSGHNLVFHEFAHKLDMLDGEIDGTPPLRGSAELARWAAACQEAFLDLRDRVERGKRTVLDDYGTVNEAEFFAVATEVFFEKPRALQRQRPDLYDVLKTFYRQDPAARLRRP